MAVDAENVMESTHTSEDPPAMAARRERARRFRAARHAASDVIAQPRPEAVCAGSRRLTSAGPGRGLERARALSVGHALGVAGGPRLYSGRAPVFRTFSPLSDPGAPARGWNRTEPRQPGLSH